MGEMFDNAFSEYKRKGDAKKVKWLANIGKIILPSQVQRIIQNDKSVLKELFLPNWVSWELVYDWASSRRLPKSFCVLCSNDNELGITFNDKFVCENCFVKIKSMG